MMLIDFNEIDPMDIPSMNQGTGTMTVRMCKDDFYRIPTTLYAGACMGTNMQESGEDMNYIIGGTGKAACDL
jgi:hypothetical protein